MRPERVAFRRAKAVCTNPRNQKFDRYGGRGIQFRFATFDEFLANVGLRPGPEYSLDRIDNDGNYEPGNVRWATATQQANNRAPRRFSRAAYEELLTAYEALEETLVRVLVRSTPILMPGRKV